MSLLWGVYLGVPLLTILINGGLAYWIYTRHAAIRGSRWFVATLGLAAVWMGFHVLGLLPVAPGVRNVAHALATKAAVWTIVAWIVFAAKYSRSDFHRHRLVRAGLGIAVLTTLLPTVWEPVRDVFYEAARFPDEPFPHVVAEPALPYALVGSLLAVLVAYALYALVRYMLSTPRRSGVQLALLVVGSLSVEVAIVLGNVEVLPVAEMEHGAYGALPFAVLTTFALFRVRLFEVRPVARNAVVEDLRDPVIVLDRDLTVVDFNPSSVAVWPSVEEAIGAPVGTAAPELGTALSAEDGDVATPDRLTVQVDGRRRAYSLTVSTIRDRGWGDADLYAVLLGDVTDLERSRCQLEKQNQRLEQVAATISHDLRNPIGVADGYAEMLEDLLAGGELDPEDAETAREHLGRIAGAHDRMSEIIEDVLALTREGQSVQETEALSLASVATDAWEHVSTGTATLTVADDRTLAADRTKLMTLLENLYRNAVEHGGDAVDVTIGPLEDGFYVRDDGPGVPGVDAEAIFEYGYTTADDGTGLGLSIVRTIAESHGWTVELDTEYADGARFTVRNVAVEPTVESAQDGATPTPMVDAPTTE